MYTHTDCLTPSSLLQSVSSASPSFSSAASTSKLYKGTRQDASSVVRKVCLSPEKSAAQGRYSDTAPPAGFGEGQVTGHTLQHDPFVTCSRHFAHNPPLYSNTDPPVQPQQRCVFTQFQPQYHREHCLASRCGLLHVLLSFACVLPTGRTFMLQYWSQARVVLEQSTGRTPSLKTQLGESARSPQCLLPSLLWAWQLGGGAGRRLSELLHPRAKAMVLRPEVKNAKTLLRH